MNVKQLCIFFIVVFILVIDFNAVTAQNTITINIQDKSLKELLTKIEDQTVYTFVYNNSEIDVNQIISFRIKNSDINSILDEISDQFKIDYQIINKQILLKKENRSNTEYVPLKVKGSVFTNKDSIPIPGVNVFVKGTSIGTITDMNGHFELSIPGYNHILVFSFIGYKNHEVIVKNSTEFRIYLDEESKLINEVVVVAYGKENRRNISSSVSDIKAEKITNSLSTDISESIKGKLPGLIINQNSGTPGAANTVRIRGISSITAGADPLYIVDGIPVISADLSQIYFNGQSVNTVTDLNTTDIESFTVLKDASATAMYGARGSNGVILITTKRGSKGESYIHFTAKYGLQQVAKTYDMLNSKQYMQYKNEAAINDGGIAIYSEDDLANITVDTDWQKELYQVAPIETYNLSLSGGSEKTFYYLVANYLKQEGIVAGTDYKRISTRINLDHEYSDKFKIGASISVSKSTNNRKEGDQSLNGPVPNAISLPPIYPVYNDDGTFNDDGPLANPISIASLHTNLAYNWQNLGNIFARYRFNKNLSYHIKYGVNYINFREHTYDPPTTRQGAKYEGLGIEATSEALKTTFSNTINYIGIIKENHVFNTLLGYEIDREQISPTFMRGESFASEDLEYLVSAVEKISADAIYSESVINSYFGRIKYSYKNKYIATINARYDGSSRFSDKNKYGFFPSGDVAWRVSDENFFHIPFINDLKIRSSYGITGNDKIPDFLYMARFGTTEYANLGGIYPINISNPDLKWETTNQFNLGLDISMFNDRVLLTADYYKKKTKGLLLEKPIPPTSGFEGVISNIGKLENEGFELNLSTLNLQSLIQWESELNVSFNKNKVTQLYNNQPIENIGRGYQRIEVGEPIGIFYGYNALGVDPSTGDIVFEDLNNDGVIDIYDREKIGSPHPIFQGGFVNNLTYKNLELYIFLQFSYGNDVFNGTRRYIESMKDTDNQTTAILDRWQEPGDITDIPRATNADPNENNRVSSRFIEDGSYLKLKSIKLTYHFNDKLLHRINLSKLSLYMMAQNLYTWTNYSGPDPEVNYAGADVVRSGVEFFTYPSAKLYSVGLSVKF